MGQWDIGRLGHWYARILGHWDTGNLAGLCLRFIQVIHVGISGRIFFLNISNFLNSSKRTLASFVLCSRNLLHTFRNTKHLQKINVDPIQSRACPKSPPSQAEFGSKWLRAKTVAPFDLTGEGSRGKLPSNLVTAKAISQVGTRPIVSLPGRSNRAARPAFW